MKLFEAIRKARNIEGMKWIAIDESGDIYAYECKPVIKNLGALKDWAWFVSYGEFIGIGEHTGTPIDWKKSRLELRLLKI